MNTLPVPSIGKIIFRRSTVRGTPHIMKPCLKPSMTRAGRPRKSGLDIWPKGLSKDRL